MIRNGSSFESVEKFIEKYFKKEEKKLFKFYFKNLELAKSYLKDDLSKNIFLIKESNSELYEKLKKK
jgi:hypothetical protein